MKQRKTILVVDDQPINLKVLSGTLPKEYHVLTAGGGKEALSVMRAMEPPVDLLLLDLYMPDMDGFAVMENMRADEALCDIPVVAVTAETNEAVELRALRMGAVDFLNKPINPRIAAARVGSVLLRADMARIEKENQRFAARDKGRREMEMILKNMDCGVAFFNVSHEQFTVSYVNEPLCRMLGYSREECMRLLKRDVYFPVHSEDVFRLRALMKMHLPEGRCFTHELRLRGPEGIYNWMRVSARPVGDDEGGKRYIITFTDIDEEVNIRKTLRRSAERDPVTGIYNKAAFVSHVERYLQNNPNTKTVILRIHIERFKMVNDVYGIAVGDELLCAIADVLREKIAARGVYGRLERDHFVICIPETLLDIPRIEKHAVFRWNANGTVCKIVLNIGAYRIDDPLLPVEQMCDRAGMAMQIVKGEYRKHFAFYDETLRENLLHEQEIRQDMHDALENGEFEIFLQPVCSLTDDRPAGAEALVRWRSPKYGLIAPGEFLPLFEKSGFVGEMDEYVWHETCHILQKRQELGLAPMPIYVNASRRSLLSSDLSERVRALVEEHGIDASLFQLEITEGAFASDPTQLVENVRALQECGHVIMMDDFGGGYSSFNTLKDISVNVLKVDMHFLQGFEQGGRVGTILSAIMRMAKWLDVRVIAEGVETYDQVEFLRSIGCEAVQGFYYSRPLPLDEFEAYVQQSGEPETRNVFAGEGKNPGIDALMGGNTLVNRLLDGIFGAIAFYEYGKGKLEVLRVNDAYYEMMMETPESMAKKKTADFTNISEPERNILKQTIKKAIETGKPQKCMTRRRRGDGEMRYTDNVIRFIDGDMDQAVICIAFMDVTEQREAELLRINAREAEGKRAELLRQNAERLLEQGDIMGAINDSLDSLLSYYEGNRAYIFEFDYERNEVSNTFERCAPGVMPQIQNLQRLPRDTVQIWLEGFCNGKLFMIPDVKALPDGDASKPILLAQEIDSLISMPMIHDWKMIGFIGVDDPSANIEDADMIYTMGYYITSELTKNRMLNESRERQIELDRLLEQEQALRATLESAKTELEQSNARIHGVLEELPCGIAVMKADLERGFVTPEYVNEGYFKMLGTVREGRGFNPGDDLTDNVFPQDKARLRKSFIQTDSDYTECNFRVLDGEGRYIWVNVCLACTEEDGKIRKYHCVFNNVDKEYHNEQQLRESKLVLATALESSNMLVWTYDTLEDRIEYTSAMPYNTEFRRVINNASGDEEFLSDFMPAYRQTCVQCLDRLRAGAMRASFDAETEEKSPWGRRWLRITYRKMTRSGFKAIGLAADITEQKQIEYRYLEECAYHEVVTGDTRAMLRYNVTSGKLESAAFCEELKGKMPGGGELIELDSTLKAMTVLIEKDQLDYVLERMSQEKMQKAFSRGENQLNCDFRVKRTNGALGWERVTADLLPGMQRDLMAFITIRDVSAEKRTEMMISSAVGRDFDYIAYMDFRSDEYFFYRNESSGAIIAPEHGSGIRNMMKEYVIDLITEDERERLSAVVTVENIREHLESDDYFDIFASMRQKDGSIARKNIRVSYIDREHDLVLATGIDVTRQYVHEQRVQETLERALIKEKKASRAKTEFLSRMSHDLRTPINAILGVTALAADMELSPQMEQGVADVKAAGNYLLSMVSDVLDISRVENSGVQLNPEFYDYNEFKRLTKTMVQPMCEGKNIHFSQFGEVPDDLRYLYVDKKRFNQIVFNLLSNAIKYTPDGGRVECGVANFRKSGGTVGFDIIVRDTGIGISKAFQRRMFDSFARESDVIEAQMDGTGLGLSIVKILVNAMKGSISVNSEKGKGTTITVHLRVKLAKPPEDQKDKEDEVEKTIFGRRVLLAEDNVTNTRIMTALLKRKGVEVESACDGKEAVELFRSAGEGRFDAVLMDIRMPVMDGWQAAAVIRTLDRSDAKYIPIIAVSANAFQEDEERSIAVGMQAHLAKPVQPQQLYETLAQCVSMRSREG